MLVEVVTETPKGSNLKYNYEPGTGFFKLKKMLPAGMCFPFDFGFIPGTLGEDGDPLDALIIAEFSNFPGCKVECRLIGGLQVVQKKLDDKEWISNDRFLLVPLQSAAYKTLHSLDDLHDGTIKEIESFFIQYTKLEGTELKITQRMDAATCIEKIRKATVAG